jgi:hypothetical protein
VAAQARRHAAARRDFRRAQALPEADGVAEGKASPSQVLAAEELLRAFRARLSDEEKRMADLRGAGQEWAEIAGQLGGTADGRRMQFQRAINRISRELGLEEDDE